MERTEEIGKCYVQGFADRAVYNQKAGVNGDWSGPNNAWEWYEE